MARMGEERNDYVIFELLENGGYFEERKRWQDKIKTGLSLVKEDQEGGKCNTLKGETRGSCEFQ
jgi:hypothetical protein